MTFAQGAGPEIALLACCAQLRLAPYAAERLRAHVADAARDVAPPSLLDPLRARAREIAARNLYATGELHRLLDVLADAGIAAMPWKGPALAAQLYGNLALRPFLDLDVLVRRRDA